MTVGLVPHCHNMRLQYRLQHRRLYPLTFYIASMFGKCPRLPTLHKFKYPHKLTTVVVYCLIAQLSMRHLPIVAKLTTIVKPAATLGPHVAVLECLALRMAFAV